tara:strand:- start:11591 stop:11974 length:384 start_codon:yes stop_codon:yes gene_type:complete
MDIYLKPLYNKIKTLLPVNTYFSLDDGDQSFIVYPTNHINLVNDFISISLGKVVYGTLTEHKDLISNIKELYNALTSFSDYKEDHCSINFIEGDNSYRLIWGGVYIDQDDKDFNSIEEMITYLKIYK